MSLAVRHNVRSFSALSACLGACGRGRVEFTASSAAGSLVTKLVPLELLDGFRHLDFLSALRASRGAEKIVDLLGLLPVV